MTAINPNNPYLGRLGDIIDNAKFDINDVSNGWHTFASMAAHANKGYQQIASDGYWDVDYTLALVAGTDEYDLMDVDTRAVRINSVRNADDPRFSMRHYVNWPDLDSRRDSDFVPSYPPVFGYYIKGTIIKLVNGPSGAGITSLSVNYSRSVAKLGTLVTPTAAAVVNKGGGLVGINAPLHRLTAGTEVTFYGNTNYVGDFTLHASTTINQLVITATYQAETLTTTAGIQPIESYTPDWPVSYDEALEYFCAREAYSRDTSSKIRDAEWVKLNGLYTKAKGRLYVGYAGTGVSMQPGRGN